MNFALYIKKAKRIITEVGTSLFVAASLLSATDTAAAAAAGKNHDFTVVIDAGHGGHDVGATDHGAREKDINLGVASKLEALIKKKLKDVNVVMTRNSDNFISLQERANIANRNRGDLFISIHTNSVDKKNPNRKSVKGSSVYALGLHKDENNLKVAQRENSVIELESDYQQKYSGFDPNRDESYIIFEMAQKKNLGQSLKFANEAQKQLVKTAGRADRGVKQAGFWVLWATSMPAVLVELDFICNPTVAAYLNSEDGQQELAQSLFNAFESYYDSHKDQPGHGGAVNASAATAGAANKSVKASGEKASPTSVKSGASKKKPAAKQSDKKTKADKKNKGKKENKSKKKAVANEDETLVTPIVEQPAEEDSSSPVVISKSQRSERGKHLATTPNPNRKQYSATGRKRRSTSAKRTSDARSLETQSIELKSETALLAKAEEKAPEVKEAPEEKTDSKDSKTKKNKKKKEKKNKSDNKGNSKKVNTNIAKGNADKGTASKSKGGKTTFTVSSSTKPSTVTSSATPAQTSATAASTASSRENKTSPKSPQSKGKGIQPRKSGYSETKPERSTPKTSYEGRSATVAGNAATASAPRMMYKIQLLESDVELNPSDPAFAGLSPVKMFRENGKYKYTYGECVSRSEIESLLMNVKSLIPDAFIIMK